MRASGCVELMNSIVYYYWYSALGPVWAETRVQSGDWYGSGTLHPGQVLRDSLPLLSPGVPQYDTKNRNLLDSSITFLSRAPGYEMWSRCCSSLEELLSFVIMPYSYWDGKLTDFTTYFFFPNPSFMGEILCVFTTFFNIQNLRNFLCD